MKKIHSLLLASAALAALSCAKETASEPVLSKITFHVNAEEAIDPAATRAVFSNGAVSFAANDQISVFDGVGNQPFTTTEGGAAAEFSGSAATAAVYNILSPYQADATCAGNVITATVPKVQTAVKDGVDPAALVAVARTTSTGEIHLKNVVGLMKVTVPANNQVKNIQVAAGPNRSVAIAGTVNITTPSSSEEEPFYQINETAEKATCVTLVPQPGNDYIAAGTYYIAVLFKTYEGGLTVAYLTNEASVDLLRAKTGTRNAVVERSKVMDLGSLVAGAGQYVKYQSNAILPAGPDVLLIWKRLANPSVAAFHSDDNVITRIEVKTNTLDGGAGVNSHTGASTHPIHAILRGGVLTLYTRATTLQLAGGNGATNMFRALKKLETVDFSHIVIGNCTTLQRMFRDCTNLQEIDLSNLNTTNVTMMDEMFYQCNNLKRVTLSGFNVAQVTTFYLMFLECQNLQYVNLGTTFMPSGTANVSRMWENAAYQTSVAAAGDDAKKCQLYSSQAYYDSVKETVTTTGFNKARFFLHVVE